MSDTHEVTTVWKEAGATLYEAYAKACTEFIEHCDDLLELFKFLNGDMSHVLHPGENPEMKLDHELRAVRSLINSKITEFQAQADKLRMDG